MKKTMIQTNAQLLEAYEDLNDDPILKFIKAFDNIFEVRDYMISIANANRKPTQEGQSPEKLVAKI